MRRSAAACALLAGCSILNRADLTDHECGPSADDDAVPLCEVPACDTHLACYPAAAMSRDPACPGLGPEGDLLVESDFTAGSIDAVAWAWLVDGRSGVSARVTDAGLLLTPMEGASGAIRTRDRFVAGGGGLTIDARLRAPAVASDLFGTSAVGLALVSPRPRERRFGWDLELLRAGAGRVGLEVHLSCFVRGIVATAPPRALAEGAEIAVSVSVGEDDLSVSFDGATCVVPRPRGGEDASLELELEVGGARASSFDPEVRLEWLRMTRDVRSQGCEELRSPLLAPEFCAGELEAAGMTIRDDVIPAMSEGRVMFVPVTGAGGPRVAVVRSSDGRHDWRTVQVLPVARAPLEVLAAAADGGEHRVWATCSGCTSVHLFAARFEDGGMRFDDLGETRFEGAPAGFPSRAAVHVRDGRHLAWFACVDADGAPAVCFAESPDGLRWTPTGAPVLRHGAPEAWDAGGVGGAGLTVTWTGRYYLMAYAGVRTGSPTAIGLAVSRDGRSWTPHVTNPLLVGEDRAFDAEGVVPVGVELAGRVTRVWYHGTHAAGGHRCRREGAASSSDGGGIALAELVFREEP